MKQVNWTVVKPEQIKGTIFEKIDDEKIPIDKEALEKTFSTKPPASKEPTG